MDKIDYFNEKIKTRGKCESKVPKYLYKYRPFDEFTFDMLKNEYVYLCKVGNLDDPTECNCVFTENDLRNINSDDIYYLCIYQIYELAKNHMNSSDYKMGFYGLSRSIGKNGIVIGPFLLDWAADIQNKITDDFDFLCLVNCIMAIPKLLKDKEVIKQINFQIANIVVAKEKMGVCSFASENDINYMWENYANHSKGYCIEYDMTDFELNEFIFPIVYSDIRDLNTLKNVIASFVNGIIIDNYSPNIVIDRSQYLRMYFTKNEKWSYQNEWRLIGDANCKEFAPKISKIIIGKNASIKDKEKMFEFCKLNNIRLIKEG